VSVVVLTKVPQPGRVKTRLVPALGAEGAAALHVAMAADLAVTLAGLEVTPTWHVAGPLDHPWVQGLSGDRQHQADGDLGMRIQTALGDGPGLALGIDAPTLPPQLIRSALNSRQDVVLGPAFDGGCWGIGQTRRHRGWLTDMAWSDHTVCAELIERARASGLTVALLPYWSDVDEVTDLRLLVQQLRILSETTAQHTRQWLIQNPEHSWRT
jgi:hypothetical protein